MNVFDVLGDDTLGTRLAAAKIVYVAFSPQQSLCVYCAPFELPGPGLVRLLSYIMTAGFQAPRAKSSYRGNWSR